MDYMLAGYYIAGTMGMPQDMAKANELYLKAGELGLCRCSAAYGNLGGQYFNGDGVDMDKEESKTFL